MGLFPKSAPLLRRKCACGSVYFVLHYALWNENAMGQRFALSPMPGQAACVGCHTIYSYGQLMDLPEDRVPESGV
jgi:hypothetical protein